MLKYHHCRDLNSIVHGEIIANPKYYDHYFKDSYLWLEKEIGFSPLFLAVGKTEEDIRMTGYQNQWKRLISQSPRGNEYRKKGEFPNYVLLSFETIEGIFMDYDYWHLVLNASHKNYQMTNYEKRLIFKPSWQKSRWLSKANQKPGSVQLVTPGLYLPDAKGIWVRNQQTKRLLEKMGFGNIECHRLLLED